MGINVEQPADAKQLLKHNIILTSIEKVLNWGRAHSLWPLTFGIACCAIEMMSTTNSRYDLSRFGSELFRPSPRQADLIIIPGSVNKKLQPLVERVYNQMADPKYVIAMGNCAISGGPYRDSYTVLPGVNTFLPVDVYIPGCPPRPEALIDGVLKLRERIMHPERAVKVSQDEQ
ncbi:MAG: NADH-quinone oxidoreductase subunit B [Syntrophomonadaceae bacterium]|nr:NADH-quinone oxidoreductase subunit B [Syntrophomonadaceae bacterium]